jgi:hypothetical protein
MDAPEQQKRNGCNGNKIPGELKGKHGLLKKSVHVNCMPLRWKCKTKRYCVEFSNLSSSCFPKGIGLVLILTSCAFPGLEKQPVAL